MSPDDKRRALTAGLAAEARRDLEALARSVATVAQELQQVDAGGPASPVIALVALSVDRAYSALEAFCVRVARELDRVVPTGAAWHSSLLHQTTLPIQDVRPAVLSSTTAAGAGALLRFRHFLRHDYRAELEWDRVRAVATSLVGVAPGIERELGSFLAGLGAWGQDDPGAPPPR